MCQKKVLQKFMAKKTGLQGCLTLVLLKRKLFALDPFGFGPWINEIIKLSKCDLSMSRADACLSEVGCMKVDRKKRVSSEWKKWKEHEHVIKKYPSFCVSCAIFS